MPPLIALVAGIVLIVWLIRTDRRHRTTGSSSLWIPGLWILVAGSRPVSYWLALAGFLGGQEESESNPANTFIYGLLIISSIVVLVRRRFSWQLLIRGNKALALIYLFFAFSTLWAPEPFVSFRRLIKDFGSLLVALVFLTDLRPWYVCRVIFVRVSCFLLPMSLVVSKYYPTIGRYSSRSNDSLYTGLTTQKNTLGEVVFLCILFLVWDLTEIAEELNPGDLRLAKRIRLILLLIGAVLIVMAQSATSQICLALGLILFFAFRKLAKVSYGPRIFRIALATIVIVILADRSIGISSSIAGMFGRNTTLTGRTDIWNVAYGHQDRTLLGFGFYSFWDTPLADLIYVELGDFIHIKTVHNGYLEVFLDGGIVGVIFLGIFILSTGKTCYKRLFNPVRSSAMPLALWVVAVIYNNSESSFFRLDLLWFTFLLLTTDYPYPTVSPGDLEGQSQLRRPLEEIG